MNEPKKTETLTLAAAMDALAREIQCADGVATAAIAEAAQRLRELEWDVARLTQQVRTNHDCAEGIICAREAEITLQHDKIGRLTAASVIRQLALGDCHVGSDHKKAAR